VEDTSTQEERAEDWRRLRNEELHNLYWSPDTIRVIKSRRIKWASRVARIGEMRNVYKILVGKTEGKRPLGRRSSRWEGILEGVLKKQDGRLWTGFSWPRIWTCGGLL